MTTRYLDRYEVLESVGTGGQGSVARARDTQHDRIVALKIRPAGPDIERAALLAEARILLELRPHPSLPYVRDDFFSGDEYVIVMDWVQGTDLRAVLGRQGDPGLPVPAVISYLSQVGEALDHLHGHTPPVVHGDVKPANCILTDDGGVVLVDFGIATGTTPAGGVHGGTRGYLAPEVAAGRTPVPASDVYGLAATAFTLLTGHVPGHEWPEFEGVAPSEARMLSRAIRLGLSTDPHRRPRSASELVERLRAWREADMPTGVITFLMTDVEGSTLLWERRPVAAATAMARHEAIIAESIESAGGRLIKARGEGDSTTSVFVKASDALLAAVAVQRGLAAEPWPEGVEIRVRTVLHTGEAQLRDGDYYGTTPNRAARLKGLADGGQIVMSQATAGLVADVLPEGAELIDLGSQRLKGLSRPERAFRLAHPDLHGSRARPAEPMYVPEVALPSWLDVSRSGDFAGRASELAELREAWLRAPDGRAALAMISGEPGIGKSRLVGEFAADIGAQNSVVLAGRCFEDSLVPYQPFVEALRSYVDAIPAHRLVSELGRHAQHLAIVVPQLAETVAHLPPTAHGHAENERYVFFDAVASVVLRVASAAPVLLVLDDLQWADATTLLLLRHVLRAAESSPLLVVGTYRDTDSPVPTRIAELTTELRRSHDIQTLELRGLDPADAVELVEARAERATSAELAHAVWRETDGNPLFIEEIVRHLLETDRLDELPDSGTLGLPADVRDLIGRRLARLSARARQTLTLAAVFGHDFTLNDLIAVGDLDIEALVDVLDETIATRLVIEDLDLPGAYRFAHALVRASLYEGLSRTRRAHLHEHIGERLEAGGETDEATLAHHFSHAVGADNVDRAVRYGRAAGDRALAQLAYEEAAGHYRRVLLTIGGRGIVDNRGVVDQRCDVSLALGAAEYSAGLREESMRTFLQAAELARGFDADRLAEAALGVGGPAWGTLGQTDETLVVLIEEALGALGPQPSVLRVRLLARLAMEFTISAETMQRIETLSAEAVSTARELDDATALVHALISRSWCVWGPGAWMERLECANEVMRLAPESGRHDLIREGRQARLLAFLENGDIAALDDELDAEARLADDLNLPLFRATVTQDRAMRVLLDGRFADAETLALASLEEGGQDGNVVLGYGAQLMAIRWDQDRHEEMLGLIEDVVRDNPLLTSFRCALALYLSEVGRFEDASRELAIVDEAGFETLAADTFTLSAAVLAVTISNLDDAGSAEKLYALLLSYADEIVNARLAVCWGSAHRYLGLLARTSRRLDTAETHFRDALDVHERMRTQPWTAHSLADLGMLLCSRGNPEEGRPLLVRAKSIAGSLHMVRLLRTLSA